MTLTLVKNEEEMTADLSKQVLSFRFRIANLQMIRAETRVNVDGGGKTDEWLLFYVTFKDISNMLWRLKTTQTLNIDLMYGTNATGNGFFNVSNQPWRGSGSERRL